ncbi:Axonemal inner arm dynein light chain, putative [Trypanosoma equiperdum]|uniref:33 kDa inner dynein arm light chain, axonemal, putative n=2 Tax=Trypanozoon TaxID=39700 RepID=Q389G1_TRYB2|nr:33 kDa inner dynein arm light chain axonemal [Trypanosoma brucei brucei TREU927]EAN78559.1 33 kDa inner dynein arm light chain, axonemal, putative [Trypanosoma brucei brucei TREU927]SCU69218.1 Axonemal inner arm dynein light chain, putative [Trypanosoma equiperdum]
MGLLKVETHVINDDVQVDDVLQEQRLSESVPLSRRLEVRKHTSGQGAVECKEKAATSQMSSPSTQLVVAGETTPSTDIRRSLMAQRGSKLPSCTKECVSNTSVNKTPLSALKLSQNASSPAAKLAFLKRHNKAPSVSHPGGAILPALMTRVTDVETLLYTLLPPQRIVCEETGETIVKSVSLEQPSRVEVAKLHERTLQQLQQRRAREWGICPLRREIYTELFDELIREITLEEPARGVLLLRIRDEMNQTLAAHRALAERTLLFASKQRMEPPEDISALRQRIKELEEEREELLVKRRMATVREEQIQSALLDENTARVKLWQDETCYYRRANRQVSQRIKTETERANAHGVQVDRFVLEGGPPSSDLGVEL